MKKVFLLIICMVGFVAYLKQPSSKAENKPFIKPKIKVIKDPVYDIKSVLEYNEKGIDKIILSRKATEKQVVLLENRVISLKKDNVILLERINNLEKSVLIKDTISTDSIKVKKKKNFIQRILNKK
jgi:hypothetical protein